MKLAELTGVSQQTISAGRKELRKKANDPDENDDSGSKKRIRAEGGGRKSYVENHPEVLGAMELLLDSSTVGNPENPLKWTVKSTRTLSNSLEEMGFDVGYTTVGRILQDMGFSLQQNRKYTENGTPDPDRNAQFEHISSETSKCIRDGIPVISVDAKKKEIVGDFKPEFPVFV